ncbi:laminin subunit alpha-like isoform X3 [Biomphalaria glabrata]|nr:laminin subunit alpha-like isoform X3 [Biomphalaria glabrata]
MLFCLILMLALGINQAIACENGWFGESCNHLCRCTECDKNALCEQPKQRCHASWFGPYCQYYDIAVKGVHQRRMRDNDQDTCEIFVRRETVVEFVEPVYFTWIRVQFDEIVRRAPIFTFRFSHEDYKKIRILKVDPYTYDYFLDIAQTIKKVRIQWRDIELSLCTLNINGGRDLAVGRKLLMSSINDRENIISSVTVDPRQCVRTYYSQDRNSSFELLLDARFFVEKISLWNEQDPLSERVDYFEIRWLYGNLTEAFYSLKVTKNEYEFLLPERAVLSSVRVRSFALKKDRKPRYLTSCDLHVYGDCVAENYGIDCEKRCSLSCMERDCYINGICRKCRPHWTGAQCLDAMNARSDITVEEKSVNLDTNDTLTTLQYSEPKKVPMHSRSFGSLWKLFVVLLVFIMTLIYFCFWLLQDKKHQDYIRKVSQNYFSKSRTVSVDSKVSAEEG